MLIYFAFVIIGIHYVTDSLLDNFTGKDLDVRYDMASERVQKWFKPIIFCTLCMSSFWGVVLQATANTPFVFVTNLFAIAGIIRLIESLLNYLDGRH